MWDNLGDKTEWKQGSFLKNKYIKLSYEATLLTSHPKGYIKILWRLLQSSENHELIT